MDDARSDSTIRRFRRGAWIPLAAAALFACAPSGGDGNLEDDEATGEDGAYLSPDAAPLDTVQNTAWTHQDWRILDEKVRWGVEQGLDTLPLGEAIVTLAESFVGTKYTPYTLEAAGPEHLVVNLRELDCVTYVENMLAMTWFIRNEGVEALSDPETAMRTYEAYLRDVRYRGGQLAGYTSRLHYFTDWINDNAEMGLVRNVTRDLGGQPDAEPINFMSTHRDAYRQLADDAVWQSVQDHEARLTRNNPRYYVPEDAIQDAHPGVEDGDVIAATSTVEGLDIAHTGIAVWKNGELHLLHAPLVGEDVQLSERTLGDRVRDIEGQDGIMVARPQEHPGARTGARTADR